MKIRLLGREIDVSVRIQVQIGSRRYDTHNPKNWGRRKRRKVAQQIDATIPTLLVEFNSVGLKILRIKAIRGLADQLGYYYKNGFGLHAAKEWVEQTYADNGFGSIL